MLKKILRVGQAGRNTLTERERLEYMERQFVIPVTRLVDRCTHKHPISKGHRSKHRNVRACPWKILQTEYVGGGNPAVSHNAGRRRRSQSIRGALDSGFTYA